MAAQNTSHAVMAQRSEPRDSRDDFPTPPWATRGLLEYVIGPNTELKYQMCLEPACGQGHMSKVLEEYFGGVVSFDKHDYGYGEVVDFLDSPVLDSSVDWVITNPPFRLAEDFISRALCVARKGVAMLTRTVFIESVGRYERLFRHSPPTKFAQFTERVPMVQGRLDKKASTATGYSWIVWELPNVNDPKLLWVPPCRRTLEMGGDYDPSPRPSHRKVALSSLSAVRQLDLLTA